jgi:hypothetical protein
MKNINTVTEGQNGEKILNINGIQSICPFVAPLVTNSNMGVPQLIRLPCTTQCPLAILENETYNVRCGGEQITYGLTEPSKILTK